MDETTNLETEVVPDDDIIEEQTDALEAEDSELDEDGNPVEPEPDDDEEEVEFEGKTIKGPKGLKDALLRQADYTRKTQEIAEQRKQYEAAIQRVSQVSEAETQALYKVAAIDAKLNDYANIDWQAWDEQDPIAAIRARQELGDLQRARGEAVNEHAMTRTQAAQLAQQETAKRLEEGVKVLAQQIPGWGAEKATAIRTFAKETYRLSDEQIAMIDDPAEVMILHDAMLYRQSQKKAATAKKVEAQQAIQPAVTVKGKGGNLPRGLSDDLSTDEWLKRRNAQVRKQRN